LDNFIITKIKEKRGEGGFGKKNQQLLSKHRAVADDKNSQKIADDIERRIVEYRESRNCWCKIYTEIRLRETSTEYILKILLRNLYCRLRENTTLILNVQLR